MIAAGEAFSTRIASVAWVCEGLRDLMWALLSASLKQLLIREVIRWIPIEYALQIARRKRGARSGRHLCKELRPTKDICIQRPKGNLCAGWCPIYSPEVWRIDQAVLLTEIFKNKKRRCCPFFRERRPVVWVCLIVWRVRELISLCACSRLSKKTAKHCENFCNLILKSISCMERKPEKLLRYSLFAVASLWVFKITLLLPTPMAVLQLYANIAQHPPKTRLAQGWWMNKNLSPRLCLPKRIKIFRRISIKLSLWFNIVA